MNNDKIYQILKSIPNEFNNSNQLYGLAYLLILDNKKLYSLENNIIDTILSSFVEITTDDRTYSSICERGDICNYNTSHYYNFALNLLCRIGLNEFSKRDNYRKKEIIKSLYSIDEFLNYESNFVLDSTHKTIGFELVVGKYLKRIVNFKNKDFVKSYENLRKERLKNFSSIIAFSPEGVDGVINWIKIKFLIKKFVKESNEDTFILNSPELTLKFIDVLERNKPGSINKLKNFIIVNKGLPPFFKGEFYDLFWSIDILNSAELLDNKFKKKLVTLLSEFRLFDDVTGSFKEDKGFSIAKGFPLYDLDTTAMGIKTFYILNAFTEKIRDFDFSYYKDIKTNLYHTFKNDNRVSLSVIAHLLNAMAYLNYTDNFIISFINDQLENTRFDDKFHSSSLYVLYCVVIALVDYYKIDNSVLPILEKAIVKILQFKNSDGTFGSIYKSQHGTYEETSWAVLAIYYYSKNISNKIPLIKDSIALFNNDIQIDNLEKEWIVKQIYTPLKLNSILINSIKWIKL